MPDSMTSNHTTATTSPGPGRTATGMAARRAPAVHTRAALSRRTMLRGLGACLGLPLLEAMAPARALAAGTVVPPKRVAFLFVPNGVIHDAWTPAAEGADYVLPSSLEALAGVKSKVNVVTGLSQIPYEQRGGVGHARPTAALLTGREADKDRISVGTSLDQIIADRIGRDTRLESLQLSIAGTSLQGECDTGYSCAYSSCISWRDETSPMPNDNNPRSVFERLFGEDAGGGAGERGGDAARDRRAAMRRSVLDAVMDDARRLDRTLGRDDRDKLSEYMHAVRQLERRVEAATPVLGEDGLPQMDKPGGRPEAYDEAVRLMGDLLVLAFQSDATRVATFMLGSAASNQSYPMIGVHEGHHYLSHHGNIEDKVAKLRRIDRFNVGLYAYLLGRMNEIPEGDGTMLDHSLVYYGSGLGNGNAHTPYDLPVLLGGAAGGAVRTGRHLRLPLDTPLNNLWLSVAHAMDVPLDRYGDSTGLLTGV